jgi:osmotically inducible protein OsmC
MAQMTGRRRARHWDRFLQARHFPGTNAGVNQKKPTIQTTAKEEIMATRKATARWNGTLKEGSGTMKYGDVEGPFTYASRFEEGKGTNPEELVGAAHSGCFSMYLAAIMSADNFKPKSVQTTASVHLGEEDGPKITRIDLACEAEVPGLDAGKFEQYAQKAKEKCPISRLFAGTQIHLSAKLIA